MTITLDKHDTITTLDTLKHLAQGPLRQLLVSERLALLFLDDADEQDSRMTMGQLAMHLGMSRASLTSLTDRLTAGGYVGREQSSTDRRVTELVITPTGRALIAAALEIAETS